MKKSLILLVIVFVHLGTVSAVLLAADPAWWTGTGGNNSAIIDANVTGNTTMNYEVLNVGQLKNVARQAQAYLNGVLVTVGGAGPIIGNLVGNFSTNTTLDYRPANIGQLKAVASPYYDRLNAISYNTTATLIARGGWGNWPATDHYAWPLPTWFTQTYDTYVQYPSMYYPPSGDPWFQQQYVPANLGQVKMVFSFDLGNSTLFNPASLANLSTNYRGVPDAWLVSNGISPFDPTAVDTDPAGDGLALYQDYLNGLDPLDKDNGNVSLILFK